MTWAIFDIAIPIIKTEKNPHFNNFSTHCKRATVASPLQTVIGEGEELAIERNVSKINIIYIKITYLYIFLKNFC